MRVAISTDGDFVSAHFGRCPSFTIIDIENDKFYIITWDVGSSTTSMNMAPEFRLRINQKGSWQAWDRVVYSNLGRAPWVMEDKEYKVFINPQVTSLDEALLVLSFDLMSFDTSDDTDSWIFLESRLLS